MKCISKTILICFMLLSIVSCKKDGESKETNDSQTEVAVRDESLHVIMNVIVPKDDNFQIYWYDNEGQLNSEHYVNIDIKGSDSPQILDFKIPADYLPTQLRFDIGSNKEQGVVKIIESEFKYLDKSFKIPGVDFWKFFGNNTSIEYNKEDATATPISNLPEGYDPILGGTENTTRELENLYR